MEKERDLTVPAKVKDGEYKKSNMIINAKGRATLLSQRLFAMSLQYAGIDSKTNSVVSSVPVKELNSLFGRTSKSLYTSVYEATLADPEHKRQSLLDWRIIIKNDYTEEFKAINVIQSTSYSGGILNIRYNVELTDQLIGLKSNYTTLNLKDTVKLRTAYSFRLYEIAKSQMDYLRAIHHTKGEVKWEVHLLELQYRFGILNAEDKSVAKEFGKDNPDYDKIETILKETGKQKYPLFSSFRRYVLDKTVNDINKHTPLEITYDTRRCGRGAKIKYIIFTITDKKTVKDSDIRAKEDMTVTEEPAVSNTPSTTEQFMAVANITMELSGERISVDDVMKIASAASYDVDKVKKAHEVAKSRKKIDNFVGFMIKAIQDNYELPVSKTNKKSSKSSFHNFEERTYDYDELEKRFVKN